MKTRLLGAVAPKADVKAPAGYGPSANVFEAETLLKSDGHARFRLSAPWHSQPLHVPAVLRWRPARGRDNGEYVRGYLLYFQAARDGFAGAFVPLANCLRAGKGCIPNDTEALRWLREGALSKAVRALFSHIPTHFLSWPFSPGAKRFDPPCLFELGKLHLDGGMCDLEASPTTAFDYFRRAANVGSVPAVSAMASLFEKGCGVARDVAQARTVREPELRCLHQWPNACMLHPAFLQQAELLYRAAAGGGDPTAKTWMALRLLGDASPTDADFEDICLTAFTMLTEAAASQHVEAVRARGSLPHLRAYVPLQPHCKRAAITAAL